MFSRTSLEVQWLRLHSQCWGPRFNPWSGNKISHAATKKKKAESGAHLIFRSLVLVLMRTQRIWDFGWLSPLAPGVHLPSLTQLSVEVAPFSVLKTRWKQTRLTSLWNPAFSLTSSWIPGLLVGSGIPTISHLGLFSSLCAVLTQHVTWSPLMCGRF